MINISKIKTNRFRLIIEGRSYEILGKFKRFKEEVLK